MKTTKDLSPDQNNQYDDYDANGVADVTGDAGGADSPAAFDARAFIRNLTSRPGVYRMFDAQGNVIYVGKARNLKNRVSSYFGRSDVSPKTRALVRQISDMRVIVTHTETEALILENNLIKEHRPRYNILLRDDKSYPYIFLSRAHSFPRLAYHRGAKREEGRYFGPYPGAGAVRETLNLLQKLFLVRQCEDSFFRNRSRPCLQYQIKRCSAPCVGLIEQQQYQQDVRHAAMFLEGRDSQIIDELVTKMDEASEGLAFEQAAVYRDQIASLRKVIERQHVSGDIGDVDVIACLLQGGIACVEVFFIRGGHNLGNRAFFPQHTADASVAEILAAFIPQYYLDRQCPGEIIVNEAPEDAALLAEVLCDNAGHRVVIKSRVKGERARWLDMALANARQDLQNRLASKYNLENRFNDLYNILNLESMPERLECFDISHISGSETVASCVVFNQEGPLKTDYRRFNIADITPGDDYAAMQQALRRRYTRLKKGEGKLPDILFIDGGKGQVNQALKVLEELQITGVTVIGVAKGPERRPGEEWLFCPGLSEPILRLQGDAPALHLIQQIRDEAHRFAIGGHRQKRQRRQNTSVLEQIPGIGAGRRRLLLKQFGGLQGVASAGVEDLASLKGINRELAQRIYDTFHVETE
jgi:excinuclease ABC subunit C